MTPHIPTPRVHASPSTIRRAATFVVAAAVMVGVPLVAQALDDDVVVETSTFALDQAVPPTPIALPELTIDPVDSLPATTLPDLGSDMAAGAPEAASPELAAPAGGLSADASPESASSATDGAAGTALETADPPDAALEAAILVMTDRYDWDERSPRVEALQIQLGLPVDGWYGQATARIHRTTLESAGLPIDNVPTPVLPPGPSADQWAALRDCESGGDYSITNPSGKYRGAYQFDRSTWNSVADRHAPDLVGVDPAAASPADQDTMALALYSERGARPWPNCGRHLR